MSDDITGLEAELRSNGISVESIDRGDVVRLTYLTAFPSQQVEHMEMGRACRTFLDLAADGEWDPRRVEATVLRSQGDVQGTWYIDPEWVEGYVSYRLDDEDFSERVLSTLAEDEPEPAAERADTPEGSR